MNKFYKVEPRNDRSNSSDNLPLLGMKCWSIPVTSCFFLTLAILEIHFYWVKFVHPITFVIAWFNEQNKQKKDNNPILKRGTINCRVYFKVRINVLVGTCLCLCLNFCRPYEKNMRTMLLLVDERKVFRN